MSGVSMNIRHYGRMNLARSAEVWTREEDEQLVTLTKENDGSIDKVAAIMAERGSSRSKDAIKNRIYKLRRNGRLDYPPRLGRSINPDQLLMTQEEARNMADRLHAYWLRQGYVTQVFRIEAVTMNKYVIRSNLVGGRPPGKPLVRA